MGKIKTIERDANGLLPNVDYTFNDDGLIDWRKMIKTEHLVANKERTNETDVTKLKDYQLIILLNGIKELAQIRGYTDVKYEVVSPSPDYVIATCSITWTPNYETEAKQVTFSAIGDASPSNTTGFGQYFLAACAENRAFVRCVRSFLRVGIVSQEELGDTNKTNTPRKQAFEETPDKGDPHSLLETAMKEKNVPFEVIKQKLIEENYDNAETVLKIKDISKGKVFQLISRIKNIKE